MLLCCAVAPQHLCVIVQALILGDAQEAVGEAIDAYALSAGVAITGGAVAV